MSLEWPFEKVCVKIDEEMDRATETSFEIFRKDFINWKSMK